uniref:Uncharacterized protein n=1 Tax=Zea mays TaxID=4577 RepID=C0HE96_MAIZE|nr:unknown [Zea mays]
METQKRMRYLEVCVDDFVHAIVLRPGAVWHGLGNGEQLVHRHVGVLCDLNQEPVHQLAHLHQTALRHGCGRQGASRAVEAHALRRTGPPVAARVRRAVVEAPGQSQRRRRRERGAPQRELVEDGRHGAHIVQRVADAGQRRDEQVGDAGLLQLPRHPPHQLRPGRLGRAQDVGGLEQLEQEAAGDGVPLRGEQADDLLEQEAVPRGDLLHVRGVAVERLVLGDVGQPPARVRLERVADGLLVDGAGGLDGDHDPPEEVDPELGDVVRPPRRRRRGRRGGVRAGDEGGHGVDAAGREAQVLAERGVVARGVEHAQRVLPAAQEAGGEERVELGREVAPVGGLRHAEVRRRAPQRDQVARAHRDGDAVAVLGAGLERLGAAREPRELDDDVAGVGAQRLQEHAFREQGELRRPGKACTGRTMARNRKSL